MKFYTAGRFQSYEKVRRMIDFLTSLGHDVTYDWTRSDEFGPDGHPRQTDPHSLPLEKLREYAALDIEGVQEAEFLVVCADDSLAGAWIEVGVGLVSPNCLRIFVLEPERWTIFLEDPKVRVMTYEEFRELAGEGL